jgi:chloramphenicol O-acetyltransferase
MGYEVIDRHPRQGQLDFYAEHPSPFFAVTWRVAMHAVRTLAHERGYSTHLTLCYYMARAMQEVEDFRYRFRDGQLVLYDRLHIGTTVPTPDGQFVFAGFEYLDAVEEFMAAATEAMRSVKLDGRLRPESPPNSIYFTALPQVPFTGVTHVTPRDRTDGHPQVAFGRFDDRDGQLEVPIGIQVNHLFIGGRALGELATRVEQHFAQPS